MHNDNDSLVSRIFIAFALILFAIAIIWLLFVLVTGPQSFFEMATLAAGPMLLLFIVLVMFVIALSLSKLNRYHNHHSELRMQ